MQNIIDDDIEYTIAEDIMTNHIHMLPRTSSIKQIIDCMNENDISAVFFYDESQNKYFIITHTDILTLLGSNFKNISNLDKILASDIMKGPVKMVEYDSPIDSVIRFFKINNYKRTLVSRNGKAVGVISLSDIREWMFKYFKSGKPQILLFIDNQSGILLGKHIFSENVDDNIDSELIELFGGAITSIKHITNEVLGKYNEIKNFVGDKHAVIFEELLEITGILVCSERSIELHQKLHKATYEFYVKNQDRIKSKGLKSEINIESIAQIFN